MVPRSTLSTKLSHGGGPTSSASSRDGAFRQKYTATCWHPDGLSFCVQLVHRLTFREELPVPLLSVRSIAAYHTHVASGGTRIVETRRAGSASNRETTSEKFGMGPRSFLFFPNTAAGGRAQLVCGDSLRALPLEF